jgi:hypothetical protein
VDDLTRQALLELRDIVTSEVSFRCGQHGDRYWIQCEVCRRKERLHHALKLASKALNRAAALPTPKPRKK